MDNYDYLFKIILVGDCGVGKSSLLNRLVGDTFHENHLSTIGVDFKIKTLSINGKSVKLQIWDTAGQERFNSITDSFFKGSHGIIIVFDLTDKLSFDNVNKWISKRIYTACDSKIIIIGNKCDLIDLIRVSDNDINNLKKTYNLEYFEASAKMEINFFEPFYQISKSLIENNNLLNVKSNSSLNKLTNTINLSEYNNESQNDKNWCC